MSKKVSRTTLHEYSRDRIRGIVTDVATISITTGLEYIFNSLSDLICRSHSPEMHESLFVTFSYNYKLWAIAMITATILYYIIMLGGDIPLFSLNYQWYYFIKYIVLTIIISISLGDQNFIS